MVKIAIDFDIPPSPTANLPAFKGVVFRYVSRVPVTGDFLKLGIYDASTGPVTLVYPVWRVTQYSSEAPARKDDVVAIVGLRLSVDDAVCNSLRGSPAPVPSVSGDATMKPFRLVALHSGGDWRVSGATYLKVPADMDIASQKAKYEEWYKGEYCRTLNTPFKVSFMGFDAWLMKYGAVRVMEEDIEVFPDPTGRQ